MEESIPKVLVRKRLASPIATGGAGIVYQDRVGAIYLGDLMTGAPPTSLSGNGRVTRVSFQQAIDDWPLDDLIIEISYGDKIETLATQITLDLELKPGNEKYREIVAGCWSIFQNLSTRPALYGFVTRANIEPLQTIIGVAQMEDDPTSFQKKLQTPRYVNEDVSACFDDLRATIKRCIGREPNIDELLQFTRSLRALQLRVGQPTDPDEHVALTRLRSRYEDLDDNGVRAAFKCLIDLASQANKTSGRLTQGSALRNLERQGTWFTDRLGGPPAASLRSQTATVVATGYVGVSIDRALAGQIEIMGGLIVEDALEDVSAAELALRSGNHGLAATLVAKLREPARWNLLGQDDQTKVALVQAKLAIATAYDLDSAESFLNEARSIGGEKDRVFRVTVALEHLRNGPEAALKLIGDETSPALLQQRALLLVALGKAQDALDLLGDETIPNDVESERIRALAHLTAGRPLEALKAIDEGQRLEPSNEGIKLAAMMAHFNCALVPGSPTIIEAEPPPIPAAYVRSDPDSVNHLRTSEVLARGLLAAERPRASIQNLEIWRLASLICDPSRREDAQALLNKLLEVDPTNVGAIGWAVVWGLNLDRGVVVASLEARVAEGVADVHQIRILASLLIEAKRPSDAARLLDAHRPLFVASGLESLWITLRAEAADEFRSDEGGDGVQPPKSPLDPNSPAGERLSVLLEAERSGDWTEAVNFIQARYDNERTVTNLIDLASTLARAKSWNRLSALSSELVGLGSIEAITLGLQGLFNDGKLEDFVDALESNRTAFGSIKIPIPIARAYAQTLHRLGRLHDAAKEYEILHAQTTEPRYLSILAQVYATLGDEESLRKIGQRALVARDILSEDLLLIAEALAWRSRDLSVRLWRLAANAVSDEAVGAALALGYRLRLDADPAIETLTTRMIQLGQENRAGITALSEHDAIDNIRKWQLSQKTAFEAYEHGQVPIHILCDTTNISIADLFDAAFRFGVRGSAIGRLFVRHGGRAFSPPHAVVQSEKRCWNLDVSAVLMLRHFGLLEAVVERVRTSISVDVLNLLRYLRARSSPAQPTALERNRRLIQRLNANELKTPNKSLHELTSITLRRLDTAASSVSDKRKSFDVNWLIRSMHKVGLVTENPKVLIKRLGLPTDTSGDIGPLPSELVLEEGVAALLEGENLLAGLSERVMTFVTNDEANRIRNTADADTIQLERADWLDRLIEFLQTVLGDQLGSLPSAAVDDDSVGVTARPLLALMNYVRGENDAIVCDDRFVTSFMTTEHKVPIVGTYEMLEELTRAGVLEEKQFHEAIGRMIAAQVYYLPIDTTETSLTLKKALTNEHGEIVETDSLRAIRRYVARTYLRRDTLIRPNQAPGSFPLGEVSYLSALSRDVIELLLNPWRDSTLAIEKKAAISDWIFEALYSDDLPDVQLSRVFGPERGRAELVAIAFSWLLARALELAIDQHAAGAFVDYLTTRLFQHRVVVDPSVLEATARNLCTLFANFLERTGTDDKPTKVLLRRLYKALPYALQERLGSEPLIRDVLGVEWFRIVEIGGFGFEAQSFWSTVSNVLATGADAHIKTVHSGIDVRVASDSDGLRLIAPLGETKLLDPAISVLNSSSESRRQLLKSHPEWIDLPSADFEARVYTISAAPTAAEFMAELNEARSKTLSFHIATIDNALRPSGVVPLERLIPKEPEIVLQYLRLSTVDSVDRSQEPVTSFNLVADVGLQESLLRYMCLPLQIPNSVIKKWTSSSVTKQGQTLEWLLEKANTPLDVIHLYHLAYISRVENSSLIRETIDSRFNALPKSAQCRTFLTLVKWFTMRLINITHGVQHWNATRISLAAWILGSTTSRLLERRAVDFNDLQQWLESEIGLTSLVPHPGANVLDVIDARGETVANLLTRGFAYALGPKYSEGSHKEASAWIDFFIKGTDGFQLPRPDLKPIRKEPNVLGSFLGDDFRPALLSLSRDIRATYSDEHRIQLLHMYLQLLEQDWRELAPWIALESVLDVASANDLDRLRQVANKIDLFEWIPSDKNALRAVLSVFGLSSLVDKDFEDMLWQKVLSLADKLGALTAAPDLDHIGGKEQTCADVITACVRLLVAHHNEPRDVAQKFAEMLLEVAKRWPLFLKLRRAVIFTYTKTLQIDESGPLDELLLMSRAM